MEFETPRALASRLKLGREEFCQRLLTTLILHGPYPRWNTRSDPSPAGLTFLRRLWEASSFGDWPGDDLDFVDEFELPPRADDEKGGAPDYAVLWEDRVWMVELKTEAGSHRRDQIPGYFELAHHHHPAARIDLTYLTPSLAYAFEPRPEGTRYAHVTWADVAPLIVETWPTGEVSGQQEVIDGLLHAIDRMESEYPSAYLDAVRSGPPPTAPEMDPLKMALAMAQATAEDGDQRALDYEAGDLEELLALRLEIRQAFAASSRDSPLRRVMPWIWRPESTGVSLTSAGEVTGHELRFSRYERSLY